MDMFAPSGLYRSKRRFRRLYDRYFGVVWAVVRSSGVPAVHREDVVQDVWMCVFRTLSRLREDASERAWLASIARKRVLHYYRHWHRQQRRDQVAMQLAEPHEDIPDIGVEARSTIDRLMAGMSEDQRTAFVLVYGCGLTGREVAEALAQPVDTIYSRLKLARRHLSRAVLATNLERRRIGASLRAEVGGNAPAQRRVWGMLVVQIGHVVGGPASVLPTWLSIVAIGAVAASAVPVAVVVGGHQAGTATETSHSPPRAGEQSARRGASVADAEPSVSVMSPTSDPLVTRLASAADDAVAPRIHGVTSRRSPRGNDARERGSIARAQPIDAPENDASARAGELAAEVALLTRAKRALDAGRPGRALRLLDEHREQFAAPALADVRDGTRVRALCASGEADRARHEALAMADADRGSTVARGVRDVCEVDRGD